MKKTLKSRSYLKKEVIYGKLYQMVTPDYTGVGPNANVTSNLVREQFFCMRKTLVFQEELVS